MKTLKASVLVTVVTIAFLMLLFVCGILLSEEYYGRPVRKWMEEQRERMWLDSAFRVYCREAGEVSADTSGYLLFPSEERSRIKVEVLPWGLYEVVTVVLASGNYSVRWIGRKNLWREDIQLYAGGEGEVFHLAGHTLIRGKAALRREVDYTAINGEFFSGKVLKDSALCRSEAELPLPEKEARERVSELCCLPGASSFAKEAMAGMKRSFREETLEIVCRDRIHGTFEGRVRLFSRSALYIGPECRLSQVLVCAPSVIIGKGFRGSLQVFARDTVVVDRQVVLEYPSGIFMAAGNRNRRIEICDSAVVNGYVIVDGKGEGESSPLLHYRQAATAKVRGLVYVNGIAQVQGKVSGALFLRDSYFFSPAGYYTDILYEAEISENRAVLWPFWLAGGAGREVVACLE